MFSIFLRRNAPSRRDVDLDIDLDDDEPAAVPLSDAELELELLSLDMERHQQRAEAEVRRDEILMGRRWSDEEREALVKVRVLELEDLDQRIEDAAAVDWQKMRQSVRDRLEADQRHRELVRTIERGNTAAKVVDFAKAHPFLAGFLGAALWPRR